MTRSAFLGALHAQAPSVDRAGKMDLYGRFIGSWDLDVKHFPDDAPMRRRKGEWHFGWVLDGRAIQDVWFVPPRGERNPDDATATNSPYGTTLRIYATKLDAWRIQWSDPVGQTFLQMIGRAEDHDIVQLGTAGDGRLIRWSFRDITSNSFLWRGESSTDQGASWRLVTEFTAARVRAA
jgi:hypothetical protein